MHAEVDPKIKALGTMAGYGTVGGVLLGVASLAFGTSGRAVSQGASLGLYAGLLFGGYVVGSHALKKTDEEIDAESEDYYPDTEESPYEAYFFNEGVLKEKLAKMAISELKIAKSSFKKNRNIVVPGKSRNFYVQLLNIQF